MTTDIGFLEIIACPVTHSKLRWADSNTIAKLNSKIAQGKVLDRGGNLTNNLLENGLVCESDNYFYPVESGIPVLLVERAIALNELPLD